jgi:hypothetical protein
LIALGVLFLVGQWLRVDVGHWGWPFFILVPGLALVAVGMASREPISQGLIVVGTVATAVGLLLFYQNMSDHWASWSYAWALIAPTAVGVGEVIYGTAKGHPEAVSAGTRLAGIGLVIFLAGAVFFELIIGVGGFRLGNWAWPFLLIIMGLVLLLRNMSGGAQKA